MAAVPPDITPPPQGGGVVLFVFYFCVLDLNYQFLGVVAWRKFRVARVITITLRAVPLLTNSTTFI